MVDGKQIPTDATQRRQLLDHRALLIANSTDRLNADQSYAVAADATLKGIFGGGGDVRKQVGNEYDRLKDELKRICSRMPALLASQQTLARDIPAFKAYATMTQNDVDRCGKGDGSFSIPFDDWDTSAQPAGSGSPLPPPGLQWAPRMPPIESS